MYSSIKLELKFNHIYDIVMDSSEGGIYSYIAFYFLTVITVSFNESLYNVNEESELVQPVLILNHPSSTDITIKIRDRQYTAKSK